MTRQEKEALINGFETAYDGISKILAVLPDAALLHVPSVPHAWSIDEHLVHLLDADLAICFRLRAAIAQPGFAIPLWEEEEWHQRLHYEAQGGRTCFGLAVGLRKITSASMRATLDHDWNEYWVQHPQRGRLVLAELLKGYSDHGRTHEGYIARNKDAWESRKS